MKKEAIDIKLNKLYAKNRNKNNFNKQDFELFINKLSNKYANTTFFVILEKKENIANKPYRSLATLISPDNNSGYNLIWNSTCGDVYKYETLKEENRIVHEGIYTIEDLEYNYQILEEYKKTNNKEL